MRSEWFLFVYHTTSILAKLSNWCFEHSGDIRSSLIVNPSHTGEFWEGRNTCLWIIYIFIYIYIYNYIYIIYIYLYIFKDVYIYIYINVYIYIYIYINIYTSLTVNDIVRLPYHQSWVSQGQETFLAPSADKQTRNYDKECSNLYLYIVYIYIYINIYFLYIMFVMLWYWKN